MDEALTTCGHGLLDGLSKHPVTLRQCLDLCESKKSTCPRVAVVWGGNHPKCCCVVVRLAEAHAHEDHEVVGMPLTSYTGEGAPQFRLSLQIPLGRLSMCLACLGPMKLDLHCPGQCTARSMHDVAQGINTTAALQSSNPSV